MAKVLKFVKGKSEKGWECWNCGNGAEGGLTFVKGEEIVSCLQCARKKWKWRRNRRKPFINTAETPLKFEKDIVSSKGILEVRNGD